MIPIYPLLIKHGNSKSSSFIWFPPNYVPTFKESISQPTIFDYNLVPDLSNYIFVWVNHQKKRANLGKEKTHISTYIIRLMFSWLIITFRWLFNSTIIYNLAKRDRGYQWDFPHRQSNGICINDKSVSIAMFDYRTVEHVLDSNKHRKHTCPGKIRGMSA